MSSPASPSISINRGESVTYTPSVTLNLHCRYAGEVQIANGATPTSASWQVWERDMAWTLSSGYGLKTVSARFRNGATDYSEIVSDSISYLDIADMTPTDNRGLAMNNLRDLIAQCSAFQTWVGVNSATLAKPRIHRMWYDTPDTFPFVLIYDSPGWTPMLMTADGFEHAGNFAVVFENQPKNLVSPFDWESELLIFAKDVNAVVEEMLTDHAKDGYLAIESMPLKSPYQAPDEGGLLSGDIRDLAMRVEFEVNWR